MKKIFTIFVFVMVLMSMVFVGAFSVQDIVDFRNKNSIVIPEHAVEITDGVFSLGNAVDVDGSVVEGLMFVHSKRENAKPSGTPGGKKSGSTTCYSHLAKGAKWKVVEDYMIGVGIDPSVTQASLEEWNSNSPVRIFGQKIGGVEDVDGADNVAPDNKNEVMFGTAGLNTIAVTTVWGVFGGPPRGRKLVEWDAVFNSAVFTFGDGSVDPNVMDYMNIAVHEFGHSAGMGHAPTDPGCLEETMYPTAKYGETKKRTLNTGDIEGIVALY